MGHEGGVKKRVPGYEEYPSTSLDEENRCVAGEERDKSACGGGQVNFEVRASGSH